MKSIFIQMVDRQKAIGEFSRLCGALTVIGVSDGEMKVIWSVIASILHLGAAGAVYSKYCTTGSL